MGALGFEGRDVAFAEGDTVASALFRDGVRTFTRSLKHHRRRGLYCGTGDCPNCLITVDGVPGVRACQAPCRDGMNVEREGGWPSTERDALHITDFLHGLMPVGFYYKAFIRPRSAWTVAERVIRRTTGLGRLPEAAEPARVVVRHAHPDVVVVGAGVAGLEVALAAARAGDAVMLCDETAIGAAIPPGPTRDRLDRLAAQVRADDRIEILECHVAVGVYEGPEVPLAGEGSLVRAHPGRIVVATGAAETHGVFPGNDLPGVWLARGAARMAGVHGVAPGLRAIAAIETEEALEHLATLRSAGVSFAAVAVAEGLADRVEAAGAEIVVDGIVHQAHGRGALAAVTLRRGNRIRRFACDTLVLGLGLAPRDALARMAPGDPIEVVGDAAGNAAEPPPSGDGYVCLCEDVSHHDLERAWDEGFRSTEILKRYTTTTMGPCQGALCGRSLACFVRDRAGASERVESVSGRATARPPARPVTLATLAASVHEVIERRTSLHDLHVSAGARMDWSGSWRRPFSYGDWREEYRAVRERVSLMDVGTLGKFLIAGPDAAVLVDRAFGCRTDDLHEGRARYVLALGEAGYVADDGLLCALDEGAYYLTSTSGGGSRMDARLRDLIDRMDLDVQLLDRTSQWGAINVAGPAARDVLSALTSDAVYADALPYSAHAEIEVADVACLVIRAGFVGELSFELHHARSQGPALWGALEREGAAFDLMPHGLDALELLRLEKGHIYVGQDTLPDDTPAKLGLGWTVDMGKGWFLGQAALERLAALPPARRLVGLTFEGGPDDTAELRGEPLVVGDSMVGRVTSAERSIALDLPVGLGWVRADPDGVFPERLVAAGAVAIVTPAPFYDPEGLRMRG